MFYNGILSNYSFGILFHSELPLAESEIVFYSSNKVLLVDRTEKIDHISVYLHT